MAISNMKYKNYQWKYNPTNLNVEVQKNVAKYNIPFLGEVIQDIGNMKKVVTGTGEFYGNDCIEQYKELYNLYLDSSKGYLTLPGEESFLAIFKSLAMQCEPGPNCIKYKFEFWEDNTKYIVEPIDTTPDYHIVKTGETLFDIAALYNTTAQILLELNKWIKRPDKLEPGERVLLK